MKVVDKVETKEELLSETQENDLFYQLVRGKDITETIETKRGSFIVKFPKEKDIIKIGRLCALRRGGIAATNYDAATDQNIYVTSFLDIVVLSGPAWYENAKNENKNFGWEEMPDIDFVNDVYMKAYTFRNKVQEQFRNENRAGDNKETGNKNISKTVQDGLFEGINSRNKR